MKKAEAIIVDYFKDKFGVLLAKSVLDQCLKEKRIDSLDSLPIEKKIAISQEIIEEVYSKFYTPDRVEIIKLLFLVQFGLNEAVGKVESILDMNVDITLDSMLQIPEYALDKLVTKLSDEEVKIAYSTSGLLTGSILLYLEEKHALTISEAVMKATVGKASDTFQMDDSRMAAMTEFLALLFPTLVDVSKRMLNGDISYKLQSIDSFTTAHVAEGVFKESCAVYKTTAFLTLFREVYPIDVYVVVVHDTDSALAGSKLLMKASGNVRTDVEQFLEKIGVGKQLLPELLSSIEKESFENCTLHDFVVMYRLIKQHSPESAPPTESIKATFAHLLGLR